MPSKMLHDIRGKAVEIGDIVVVGAFGDAENVRLQIRQVVGIDSEETRPIFRSAQRTYTYRASCGYLILPRSYRDAFETE